MALSALRTPAEVLANAAALMDPFWKTVWPDDWNDRRKDIDAILLIASEHASLDGILTAVTLDHSLDKKNTANSEKSDEKPVTNYTITGSQGHKWTVGHNHQFIQETMPKISTHT